MTALATVAQLKNVMLRDLGADDLRRAPQLLAIASTKVRTYTGVNFTSTTETKRLRVRAGKVRLPQAPVTAVSGVVDMDGNTVSHEWYAGRVVDCNPTLLNEFEINLRRIPVQWVDVTYTHGYDPIPDDVVGVVCDMVAAALDSPPEGAPVVSETMGPFSESHGTTGSGVGGVQLTQTMRDALFPYMSPAGTVTVS